MDDDDLIILDDEMHLLAELAQQQQQQQLGVYNPGPSMVITVKTNVPKPKQETQQQRTTRGRGVKRTSNGAKVVPTKKNHPRAIPEPDPPVQCSSSVIVDGQDVYYIQEVGDDSSEAIGLTAEDVPYLNSDAIVSLDDDGTDTDEAPEGQEQQLLKDEQEYYNVEPLELSDVWNDLITANQEILILLELSDLKDHIVDARRIEEQIKDMACEYCNRIFPDIKTLDRHIRKIHFTTELFECDSCDGKFQHFARFKDHLNGHTGDRVYQCDECNHQYAFRMGFLVHKILDHMKLNGVYVCPKCDLDCRDAQNYKLHIASHIEFGPSSTAAQVPAQPSTAPVAATAPAPARSNNGTQRKNDSVSAGKTSSFFKENERNKFLNVFESFSKNRNVEQSLSTVPRNRKKF
ncbi:zinc finger protein 92-like [Armigeres subalbatus]|uniref:zinc finger protein 92-like n=1 Tax=Armigeres subalbatus TaxID=124917 RepID=UPI002ED2946C